MPDFSIKGNIVKIEEREIFYGEVFISGKQISRIEKTGDEKKDEPYIIPGFTDSHVHIESSLLVPSQFARLAVVHGTVASISDPHEIANVCGIAGVHYMINEGNTVPFKFHFGAPSCVPATIFETAGAAINSAAVDELLQHPEINYLSEMMNFPGVLYGDEEVMAKIASAKKYGKPVDGHAPGLMGEAARNYINAGISTDHECFTAEEALDKLGYGMKILVREGSAAKNFDALEPLLADHFKKMMFCSDDKHPDSLLEGHINQLCARAVAKGNDVYKVLQAACINPVLHYKMRNGILKKDQPADIAVVRNLQDFQVLETYIDGVLVAKNGTSLIETTIAGIINQFDCDTKTPEDFQIRSTKDSEDICIIEALDGQLITNKLPLSVTTINGLVLPDTGQDIVKIAVVNRYFNAPVATAFIKNTGIKHGAIASSVAHDSHNIVAIGADDESICRAVNLVIAERGGLSAVAGTEEKILALPVGGLMSNGDGYEVAAAYTEIDHFVKQTLGSSLKSPFMTASFMALLVIPHLKLSDKGLFDGDSFSFITNT
ncbi:MAG: adenine deaminase [Ferruginibacter sp.]